MQSLIGYGMLPEFPWPDWFGDEPREQAADDAEEKIDNIFAPIRESDAQIAAARNVAGAFCESYGDLKDIDSDTIDAIQSADDPAELPTEARHNLSRLEGILELCNQYFEVDIDTAELESVDEMASRAANLIPLVLSSKHVVDSGCTLMNASEGTKAEQEAFEEFLLSCGTLTAEVLMIQYSAGYRVSFWATRNVANRMLVHIRGLVGLKAYALLLREVHWTVRENLADAVAEIIGQTDELREMFPEVYATVFDEDDLEELRELQGDVDAWRDLADMNVLNDGDSIFYGDDWSLLEDDGDHFDGGYDFPI